MVIRDLGVVTDQTLVKLYDVRVFLPELITGPVAANYDVFWHREFFLQRTQLTGHAGLWFFKIGARSNDQHLYGTTRHNFVATGSNYFSGLDFNIACVSVHSTRNVIHSGLRFRNQTAHLLEAVYHASVTDVTRRYTRSLKPVCVGLCLVT